MAAPATASATLMTALGRGAVVGSGPPPPTLPSTQRDVDDRARQVLDESPRTPHLAVAVQRDVQGSDQYPRQLEHRQREARQHEVETDAMVVRGEGADQRPAEQRRDSGPGQVEDERLTPGPENTCRGDL